jgi:uncharacterized damage-inducible protein DinB
MPPHDPTAILLDHNRWANAKLAEACASLSEEQLHRKFEMGLGSVHDTLGHIISAMKGWTSLLDGREWSGRPQGLRSTLSELVAEFEQAADELARAASAGPLEQMFSRERGGKVYQFARGMVITHVTTHGMHHRAQCLNMLRHLGVSPLPKSAVVEWSVELNPPA